MKIIVKSWIPHDEHSMTGKTILDRQLDNGATNITIKLEDVIDTTKLEKVLVLLGKGTIGTTDEMITEAYKIVESLIGKT